MEEMVFYTVQGFVGGLLIIIFFFLKDAKKQFENTLKACQADTAKVRDDLNRMKSELPQVYVFREDYIRTMADFGRKLDRLLEHNGR